ncbi:MAG: hypothetical protein AAFV69_09975 [Pseudomonadota bacterium]
MRRGLTTSICLIVLAWLGLSASTWGLVVWQSGPRAAPGHVKPAIFCTYFDGTKLFERGFLYAPDDQMGYNRCPMWVPV